MADIPEAENSTEETTVPANGPSVPNLLNIMHAISKRSDLLLAFGVVGILVVLILPLPTWLMDLGLAFSITFSVIISYLSFQYIEKPYSLENYTHKFEELIKSI